MGAASTQNDIRSPHTVNLCQYTTYGRLFNRLITERMRISTIQILRILANLSLPSVYDIPSFTSQAAFLNATKDQSRPLATPPGRVSLLISHPNTGKRTVTIISPLSFNSRWPSIQIIPCGCTSRLLVSISAFVAHQVTQHGSQRGSRPMGTKMKKLKGLNIESGIDKTLHDGPVYVGKLGSDGDEHDYTFHGGPDKAVHGCKSATSAFLYLCCFRFQPQRPHSN